MIRRFIYIFVLLLFAEGFLIAKPNRRFWQQHNFPINPQNSKSQLLSPADTFRFGRQRQNRMELMGGNTIKEVAKAKRKSKPEKVMLPSDSLQMKDKLKRQRRPEGMERPPEIPRRNNN